VTLDRKDYASKLYYSARDTESEGWDVTAPVPPKIMFEITNACNHRCIFCYNPKMKRAAGNMDRDSFLRVAREARDLGVRECALYTTGESLLHPEIAEFVRLSKDLGFEYVYLASNAALLTPELSRRLIEAGLDSLRISINAGTRDTYRRVHGEDEFDLVVANVKEYDRIRKELGRETLLSVSCVVTRLVVGEKEALEALLGSVVDSIKWTDIRVQGGNMLETVRKLSHLEHDPRYALKPCGLLWNGFHVDYAGNLTICCVDFDGKLLVGNVLEKGLMECWNGPEMQELRHQHLTRTLPTDSLCYKCLTGPAPVETVARGRRALRVVD
jgi:MoaA/NifB/PqqE/SkfB family radical SAM enzyme